MKTIKIAAILLLAVSVSTFAQKKEVSIEKSVVKWTGNKIGKSHHGTIGIKSGYLELTKEQITGGEIVIDMNTIKDLDLTDPKYNDMLVGHLKSDDFFGVEKYPTAKFLVTKATKFKDGKATVTGKITIKEKTEIISFDVSQKGSEFTTEVKIDRSKFDVRYGSDSFFDNLGDKAIDNIFILDISLYLK